MYLSKCSDHDLSSVCHQGVMQNWEALLGFLTWRRRVLPTRSWCLGQTEWGPSSRWDPTDFCQVTILQSRPWNGSVTFVTQTLLLAIFTAPIRIAGTNGKALKRLDSLQIGFGRYQIGREITIFKLALGVAPWGDVLICRLIPTKAQAAEKPWTKIQIWSI